MAEAGKKAQNEIFGLLIIVIIVAMLILFGVSSLLKPTENIKKKFSDDALASAMLGAMLKTSTCGSNTDIADLLIDCAKSPGTGTSRYNCNGQNSCEHAEMAIKKILSKTMDEWHYTYEFIVLGTAGDKLIYYSHGNTTASKYGRPQLMILPVHGYGNIKLLLCIGRCGDVY